ncbi:MAG: bifunctional 4-hydroxy-2-oxoglutarate aldolase/2-dehydro-3-deoxy-phosphogluconate aldolase, partial [Nannocystaceae bacterium]
MSPDALLSLISTERASAILRTDDQMRARKAMDAAVRGGMRVVEFTLTVPGVFELIEEFAQRDDVVVGAGTVLTPAQANDAVDAGARFLVSPVVDEEVIEVARTRDVVAMPGVHTPTELLRAHRAGAQLQKLFPAPAGGPAWVRSVLGPMPFLKIVPTNGTSVENAQAMVPTIAFVFAVIAKAPKAPAPPTVEVPRGRAVLEDPPEA